jgi:hypothetical protein
VNLSGAHRLANFGDDLPMSLIPLPTATIDDSEMACVLRRAVGLINPVLDLLAGVDLLGLKKRTHALGDADSGAGKVLDAAAWVLNAADVPGTEAWEGMDLDDRINWWVRRVGAVDTIVVAVPGAFGAVADRLPVQDLLAFANQSIVLCAVARELGVTDRREQVLLLGAVMCDRDLGSVDARHEGDVATPEVEWTPVSLGRALWQLAGLMRAIGDELVKRPRPRSIFRYLGMLPAAGAVADFLGEYGALVRAAKEGRQWITQHEAAIGVPART